MVIVKAFDHDLVIIAFLASGWIESRARPWDSHCSARFLERLLSCLLIDGIPRGGHFIRPSNRSQAAQMLNDTCCRFAPIPHCGLDVPLARILLLDILRCVSTYETISIEPSSVYMHILFE